MNHMPHARSAGPFVDDGRPSVSSRTTDVKKNGPHQSEGLFSQSKMQNPKSKLLVVPPTEHHPKVCGQSDFVECIEIPV
jgi:hypothetical protein